MTLIGLLFFGAGLVAGIIMLQPGSSMLRLDGMGFEITNFYWKKVFSWKQVSDFEVYRYRSTSTVRFRVDGRKTSLPDTYGFSPSGLVYLLTEWRGLAMGDEPGSATPTPPTAPIFSGR
jgi:hypothetical protein